MTETSVLTGGKGSRSLRIATAFVQACCVAALALLVAVTPARADEQEDEYLRIYQNIQDADSLDAAGRTAAALTKYQQAHSDLVKFRKAYPNWNRDMVSFRFNYVAEKATSLNDKLNAAAPAAGASSTNAASQGEGQAKGPPTAEQPIVTLLEPGAEPRKVLRLQPKAGEKQTVALTMKMTMDQGPFTNLPAVVITSEVTINDVSADGDIGYDNIITDLAVPDDASANPQVVEAMKMAFASLKGLTTSGVISSRGFSKRREIKQPASGNKPLPAVTRLVTGQMEMGLTTMTAPLPEEAVGTGAKWEVKMMDKSMSGVFKTAYEVVSLEGGRVVTRTSGTIATLNQKAENPPKPDMKGEGKGEVTIDLAHIMPQGGNLLYSLDMSAPGRAGGQQQGFAFKITMDLSIETK